tara:strand:+ start:676 stop:3039 length:2364 start_codon:yes stop_codon:yes gene_type:complete
VRIKRALLVLARFIFILFSTWRDKMKPLKLINRETLKSHFEEYFAKLIKTRDESNHRSLHLVSQFVYQIVQMFSPTRVWADCVSDNFVDGRDFSIRSINRLPEVHDYNMKNRTYFYARPIDYYKFNSIDDNWYSGALLYQWQLSHSNRFARESVEGEYWSEGHQREVPEILNYDNHMRSKFNLERLMSNQRETFDVDFKVLWRAFFLDDFFKLSDYADHSSGEIDQMIQNASTTYLEFNYRNVNIVTNKEMNELVKLNERLILDYRSFFNAQVTNKSLFRVSYPETSSENRIVRMDADTSCWYTAQAYYAMRCEQLKLSTPSTYYKQTKSRTHAMRKLSVRACDNAGRAIKAQIERVASAVRVTDFNNDVRSYLFSQMLYPSLIKPVANWFMKLRESLLRFPKDGIPGVEVNFHRGRPENSSRQSHSAFLPRHNATEFHENSSLVDEFIESSLSRLMSDNASIWMESIWIVIHRLDVACYAKTPRGDRFLDSVEIDYSSTRQNNNGNTLWLSIPFSFLNTIFGSRENSNLLEDSFMASNSFDIISEEDAFTRYLSSRTPITRMVEYWYDEDENDEEYMDGEYRNPHPFIEGEQLCVAQYEKILRSLFAQGDITGLIVQTIQWLSTYLNTSEPYNQIAYYTFGARPDLIPVLSNNSSDYGRFSTQACGRRYTPSFKQCRDVGCAYATDDAILDGLDGRYCDYFQHRDETKTYYFKLKDLRLDKASNDAKSAKEERELEKVRVVMANKLTRDAMQSAPINQTEAVLLNELIDDAQNAIAEAENTEENNE